MTALTVSHVSGVSAVTPSSSSSTSSSPTSSQGNVMGEQQFFKILSAELANQSPTSPANSTTFITQMAQFSQLSALSNIQSALQSLVQADQSQAAPILNGAALLGKTVHTAHGSGIVQGAAVRQGVTYLTVKGQASAIPLSAVTAVTPPS